MALATVSAAAQSQEDLADAFGSASRSELSQQQVYRVLRKFTGQASVLTIPRVFIAMTGNDHMAALLLSQCLYWTEHIEDSKGWFFKSYKDWEQELGLSQYQVSRAASKLAAFGLETALRRPGSAPVLHYRINPDLFVKSILAHVQVQVQVQVQQVEKSNNKEAASGSNEQPQPQPKVKAAIPKLLHVVVEPASASPSLVVEAESEPAAKLPTLQATIAKTTRPAPESGELKKQATKACSDLIKASFLSATHAMIITQMCEEYGPACVRDAAIEAAKSGGNSLKYVEKILEAWKANGGGPGAARNSNNSRQGQSLAPAKVIDFGSTWAKANLATVQNAPSEWKPNNTGKIRPCTSMR